VETRMRSRVIRCFLIRSLDIETIPVSKCKLTVPTNFQGELGASPLVLWSCIS